LFNLYVRLFSTKKHRKCKDKKIHFKIFFHKNFIFFFKNPEKTLTAFRKSPLHSMMDDFGSSAIFCNAAGTMAIANVQRSDR